MRLLLTGASGFIGRNLRNYWNRDCRIELIAPSHDELDLFDEDAVRKFIILQDVDAIVHTANVNATRNYVSYSDQLNGNLRMFFNLVSCKDYYDKMYYFGSGAEYCKEKYIPNMKEEYFGQHIPMDAYGFSKYVMAQVAKGTDNIFDLRLFGVYGPYEEYGRRFISNAICRALKGKEITIDRNVFFDYMWIGDLCKIMDWIINHTPKYHHYNVCTGTKIDLYSIAETVRECLSIDCDICVAHQGYKKEYTGDNSRLLSEMGKFVFVSHKRGITELIKFYKENINMIDELII